MNIFRNLSGLTEISVPWELFSVVVFSRWSHGECDSIMTEEDAEKCHVAGYSCQLCRPQDVLPPHLAMQSQEEREQVSWANPFCTTFLCCKGIFSSAMQLYPLIIIYSQNKLYIFSPFTKYCKHNLYCFLVRP